MAIICKKCQLTYLNPELSKREIEKNFFVYSFYEYDTIKVLLNAKYHFCGDRVYKILANLSFKKFSDKFMYSDYVDAVCINDSINKDYNQSAILTKSMKSNIIKPKYYNLISKNNIKYAGKSLRFRKDNPRNFLYRGEKNKNIILIDDIVTTGSTLIEAKKILKNADCNILFAMVLCDAKN